MFSIYSFILSSFTYTYAFSAVESKPIFTSAYVVPSGILPFSFKLFIYIGLFVILEINPGRVPMCCYTTDLCPQAKHFKLHEL